MENPEEPRHRSRSPATRPNWRFLATQAHAILAVDLAHVDTILLRHLYILVVIEHGTRRARIAEITAHPTGAWVTQQARNLLTDLADHPAQFRLVIHDRDAKYTAAYDTVFADAEIRIIRTPVRAPRANAIASAGSALCATNASTTSSSPDRATSRRCCRNTSSTTTPTARTDRSISTRPQATLPALRSDRSAAATRSPRYLVHECLQVA